MPYSMAALVNDPTFAQSFTITRSQGGSWVNGVWTDVEVTVNMWGIVQPAYEEDLDIIPEGDRIKAGTMIFHSSQQMYETSTDPSSGTARISDIVNWNGQQFKLIKIWPWQDFGYFRAIGTRITGE